MEVQACVLFSSSPLQGGGGGGGFSNGGMGGFGGRGGGMDIPVPRAAVGIVIGKGGEMIKKIQQETGAKVCYSLLLIEKQLNIFLRYQKELLKTP